jgi:16S rRNA (guanine966-N2)-methyltransferase
MRIVGGELRGARLSAPEGMRTRPTSDRVRESLFNILVHSLPAFSIEGARVLDLFAGTGALGLEALSRGAEFCLFVDSDAEARGAQRDNIEALKLGGRTRLFRRDARKLGPAGNMGRFGLVFLDPPYGQGLAEPALQSAIDGGWLLPGAVCVVEEAADSAFEPPAGLSVLDRRRYGDTQIIILRNG